jgi:hypothetical protein
MRLLTESCTSRDQVGCICRRVLRWRATGSWCEVEHCEAEHCEAEHCEVEHCEVEHCEAEHCVPLHSLRLLKHNQRPGGCHSPQRCRGSEASDVRKNTAVHAPKWLSWQNSKSSTPECCPA